MADCHGPRAALGQCRFGWVVGGIEIDVGKIANQAVRPIRTAQARLFTRHELQRAMHAEMQYRISVKAVAQPKVKLRKGMGGRKAVLKQQAHRVALIAEARLQSDKDFSKLLT